MLVMARELKRARGDAKISQALFRAYANLYAEAIEQFIGDEVVVICSTKTNSVYIHPPLAGGTVRISDHKKHGKAHTVLIKGRHPKDDDLALILDEAFRNCYRNHHGHRPEWKEILESCSTPKRMLG